MIIPRLYNVYILIIKVYPRYDGWPKGSGGRRDWLGRDHSVAERIILSCRLLVLIGFSLACSSAEAPTGSEPELLTNSYNRIEVTPSAATRKVGVSVRFRAWGFRSPVDSVLLSPQWTATGGSITSSGAFTSNLAGQYTVFATTRSIPVWLDSAKVSVKDTAVASGPIVNECATPRAGWLWCDDFEQDRRASYFEYDNAGGSLARTNGVGNAGSWGLRTRFAAGQVSAGGLHLAVGRTPQAYFRPVDAGTTIYRDLYWRMYLRNQPGWVGGAGDKFTRAFSFASSSSWAQAMFAHLWGGTGTEQNYLVVDPASGTDPAGDLVTTTYNDFAHMRWLGRRRGSTPLFDSAHVGQWYCIEVHARLNDSGLSNGVEEFWINGGLEASATGLNYLGQFSTYGINAVFFESYWTGGAPQAQERYFDNLVVSTKRIGC